MKKSVKNNNKLVWTPQMSVHESTIDMQHQKLISKLNELVEDAKSNDLGVIRGTIEFLQKYHLEHFQYEEAYMKKNNYPKLKEHIAKHNEFNRFFEKYGSDFKKLYSSKKVSYTDMAKLLNKAKDYLGDWLTNHIMKADHDYYIYINSHEKKQDKKSGKIDMAAITAEVQEQLTKQRAHVESIANLKDKKMKKPEKYIKTGVLGFDELFENGIPQGNSVIVAGGAGSGKTIFCLQTLMYHASKGDKCFYMSFEESEKRLKEHMENFGWDPDKMIKAGKLKVARYSPFDITRSVDAMLAKEKGELLIDIDPVIIPKDFKPDFIVLDSLTAIASAFTGKEDSYRIYIEQLFRFFEKLESTAFLVTETEQVPKIYSTTGVEEFLADGVIVLYNIKRGDVRENAIEVLKMRGEKHQKKIVAMQITGAGVVVYPDQEVFGEI